MAYARRAGFGSNAGERLANTDTGQIAPRSHREDSALACQLPEGSVMAITKTLNVNGERVTSTIDDPDMPLLYLLRGNLGLHGPRFGCGLAQCGACTVHLDGQAVRSCVLPLSSLNENSKVVTLEGLGTPENLHPVQRAFIQEQAAQCGYCINGMIMQAAAFLAGSPKPSEADVKNALAANLCRCGTHARIVRAVMRAADTAQGRQ
jgi:nicotinate dehydrogenase subunit A